MQSPSACLGAPASPNSPAPRIDSSNSHTKYNNFFGRIVKKLRGYLTKVPSAPVAGNPDGALCLDENQQAALIGKYIAPRLRESAPKPSPFLVADVAAHFPPPSVGVDMPGVGLVHAADPMQEVPEPLRSFVSDDLTPKRAWEVREQFRAEDAQDFKTRRDRLIAKLLFEARHMAHRAIGSFLLNLAPETRIATCKECKRQAIGVAPIEHTAGCSVGGVLDILEQLMQLSLEQSQTEKEEAPGGEGRAADGIPSRGDFGEPWKLEVFLNGRICIYDETGMLVVAFSECDETARKQAARIVDCVNSCAPKAGRL